VVSGDDLSSGFVSSDVLSDETLGVTYMGNIQDRLFLDDKSTHDTCEGMLREGIVIRDIRNDSRVDLLECLF
jgi:hypothetical protein